MSKINCIILEDEPLAVKVLADYIRQVSFLELKATFKNALQAAGYIRENHIDLLFLDIHLPRLKGIDFLKTLVAPPAVIITTAYHQYAVEGFNLSVTDYLLKPFEFERFLTAVNKVKTAKEKLPPGERKNHLFLTIQKKKVKLVFTDILYIESQREYSRIVTIQAEYLPKISTQDMEALLPGDLFKRVHRSFIISINRIDSYTADTVEVGGTEIPIGRGYRGVIENL